jgi:hypothetical protein
MSRAAKRVAGRRVEPLEMDQVLDERLRDAYREEVARLRELTGQAFAGWRV